MIGTFPYYGIGEATKTLPYGELTMADENLLREIGEDLKSKQGDAMGVDLGTFLGRSAAIMSGYLKKVITVDVFEKIETIENESAIWHYKRHLEEFPRSYELVEKNLKRFPNIEVVQWETKKYAQFINDKSIDFLSIDADHTYPGVKSDFEAYLPKMKSGGIIFFHDAGPQSRWLEPRMFVKTLTLMEYGHSDCAKAFYYFC